MKLLILTLFLALPVAAERYAKWQGDRFFASGLSGSVHYTWGKSLSTAGGDVGAYYQGDGDARTQDFFNPRADRGPSTGDITHYFNSEWIYEVPRIRGLDNNSAAKFILGGWQVSGILLTRTGIPVQLSQAGTGLSVARPDYNGGQAIFGDYKETLRYLNPAAFALVPINPVSRITVRPGNVGNNAFREPGAWNVNFAISKEFPITERSRLRVGMDGFNFFNHTNLSGLVTGINNVFFSQLQNTGGAWQIQLNARLIWSLQRHRERS